MQIVVARVGLGDGLGYRFVWIVAGEPDAGGAQVGLHGIRNPVHVILFALPDDIGVVLLGGRAEKNGRHGVFSFFIS